MATAARSIDIHATPEEVWEYLRTPANIVEWWPGCEAIHDVAPQSDGGFTFQWIDKPAGVTCRGEIEETIVEPGEGIRLHIGGDICGEMRWRVHRENGGVRVRFESDYDLPVRALIPHLSPIRILRFQEDEADAIANRLRQRYAAK